MKKYSLFFLILISTSGVWASNGNGTAVGAALLRISGARSSALGDAFTAMNDDIRAMEFNPGSLGTLQTNHASLQYQAGFADDAYSKVSLGWKQPTGVWGASVGHYDSGDVVLFDGNNVNSSVTAEEDWLVNVGYGRPLGTASALGLSVRYFSSKLAEAYSDSAVSVHAGVQMPLYKQIRWGMSGPLVQSKFQYGQENEDLPRVYRVGFMSDLHLNLATGQHKIKVLLDVPYDAKASRFSLAGGIETHVGPMALRAGSNGDSDVNNFTLGAGFSFSRFTIDYAFGLVNSEFQSLHNVNFSMRFDAPSVKERSRQVYKLDPNKKSYVVRSGDTLVSIATELYGDKKWSSLILYDNKDKISDPDALPVGLRLVLP